jgi:hypothetical protein
MCDYSLHAVASRPATVGETLVTTTFPGTTTRGFASERDPAMAVCLLPGTELAFEEKVLYYSRWVWKRTIDCRVGKFGKIGADDPHRHHDAIEFPDGRSVLVTLLLPGQKVSVLQLPVNAAQISQPESKPAWSDPGAAAPLPARGRAASV